MADSLPELEAQRSKILRQFSQLGDLRPGSICAVARRCGKPTCHCAKPKDAGHDPQMRLTHRVNGRTVAESFPTPAALSKAQMEIEEYQSPAEADRGTHRRQREDLQATPAGNRPARRWTPEEKNGCCDP